MPTFDFAALFAAATPEDRDTCATAFASSVNLADLGGLNDTVIATFKKELADKGKAKANNRAGALRGARALVEKHGASAESIACMLLQEGFEAMADKLKPVSVEADKFVGALFEKLSPHSVKAVLPDVLREYDGKWQSNLGRATCLKTIADKFPKQTNRSLTDIVPVLSGLMWDTKAQVKEQATEAMKTVCATCSNKDISGVIPAMVDCIAKPETTPATIHTLASVIFVQEMDGSALAIMSPLLKRGMDEPATAVKRNVARIIENMAKLVDDPYEVEPFIPLLLPTLKRAKEEVSDPEARDVMGKAHDQLERTIKKPPLWQKIERPKVVANATELAGKGANADVLAHIAEIGRASCRERV